MFPPQMQLTDNLPGAAMGRVQINLAAQVAQVHIRTVVVLGDDFVASAVVTQRFAKGDMDVQGQWQRHRRGAKPTLRKREGIILLPKSFDKPVGRWV